MPTIDLFSNVHLCLSQILTKQKAGKDAKDAIIVLRDLLEASYSDPSISLEERTACRSAIIVALRLAANNSVREGWWSEDRFQFAKIIHIILNKNLYVNNGISEHSTLRWNHIHPLLACLLCDISTSDNSTCVLALLQAILSLIELICGNNLFRKDFFSPSNLPGFGKLVSICLDVITDTNRTSDVRMLGFSILSTILNSAGSDVCSLTVLFPGLVSQLTSVAIGSINENLDIIEQCLKVFSLAVVICLKNSTVKGETTNNSFSVGKNSSEGLSPAIKELLVTIDDSWLKETSSKVKKLLISITSNLSVHRAHSIRLCLINSVNEIYSECSETFKESLDDLTLDLILILGKDEYESISRLVSDIVVRFRAEKLSVFSIHMHDKLKELSDTMPQKIRRESMNCKTMFDQLSSVLHCLKPDLEHLAMSRSSALQSLLQALAVIIRVDTLRLMISRNDNKRVIDLLLSLPLLFNMNIYWIHEVCKALAIGGGMEIVNMLHYEMLNCSLSDRVAYVILTVLIIESMPSITVVFSIDILQLLIESCIDWLSTLKLEPHVKDGDIEDLSRAPTLDTVFSITLSLMLGTAISKLDKDTTKLKFLIDVLNQLLYLCSVPNWLIQEAAEVSLSEIAQSMSLTTSEMLSQYSSYIVHCISIASRTADQYHRAPSVLSALLDRVDDKQLFDPARHIANDLMRVLDRHNQECVLLILRSLLSFVRAINRWYPELSPTHAVELSKDKTESLNVEKETDDINDSGTIMIERGSPPLPVQSVELVLHRTKHLLASQHLPVCLVVLDTLREGLWVLRNFDDSLLPLLHQNWTTLINRFMDNTLTVRIGAILVVRQMVRVAKTFVYRRIRDELWPIINKWMLAERSNNFYTQTAAFKYQVTVLESVADIWIGIDMDDKDSEVVFDLLDLYTEEGIRNELRMIARISKKQIEQHLKAHKS